MSSSNLFPVSIDDLVLTGNVVAEMIDGQIVLIMQAGAFACVEAPLPVCGQAESQVVIEIQSAAPARLLVEMADEAGSITTIYKMIEASLDYSAYRFFLKPSSNTTKLCFKAINLSDTLIIRKICVQYSVVLMLPDDLIDVQDGSSASRKLVPIQDIRAGVHRVYRVEDDTFGEITHCYRMLQNPSDPQPEGAIPLPAIDCRFTGTLDYSLKDHPFYFIVLSSQSCILVNGRPSPAYVLAEWQTFSSQHTVVVYEN